MTPTLALIIAVLVMMVAATLVGLCFGRASADGQRQDRRHRQERRRYQDLQMRYVGEGRPCIRCGLPTHYSLKGRSLHPECRAAVEADLRAVKHLIATIAEAKLKNRGAA